MKLKPAIFFMLTITGAVSQAQLLNNFHTEVRVMIDSDLREQYAENNPDLVVQDIAVADVGEAHAQGQLDYGVNKVLAHFDAYNPDHPAEIMMADTLTQWIDEVTIDGGALNGTLGTFHASLRVSGSAHFSMTGAYSSPDAGLYGFWNSWIGTRTDGGASYLVDGWFGNYYSDGAGGIDYLGDDLNQPMTDVTLEFIYGQPFLLSGMMESYFDAQNPELLSGTVSGTMDFSHSAYWNGMRDFRDSNGNLVNIISLSSQSGVNWINAVPEPSTMIALFMGAVGLVSRRRRRSRT